jgi:ubiquinone biosynthesis protein Coq4
MVLEPERLRVLRLRRCHDRYHIVGGTLSHWSERQGEIYLKVERLTNTR